VVVVSYAQAPVGWWQDAKGQMQPPGSFLSPALRVPSGVSAEGGASTPAVPAGRFKKWTSMMRHRSP
jgi:hypothetical protein